MLKFPRSYAALSAFALMASTPEFAHARPLSVISGYPVVPRSQTNSLICYMRTQKGALLNLGSLCGDNFIPTNVPTSPAARRAASLPGGNIPKRTSSLGGYGAIAFSPSTKRFGSTGPRFTQAEAEALAKKLCGQKDCTVGLSFRNSCGAFALKGNKASYGKAGSEADASKAALSRSGKGGKVIVSFCSRQSPSLL